MAAQPPLRAYAEPEPDPEVGEGGPRRRWTLWIAAFAVLAGVGLAGWIQSEQRARIAALEAENTRLVSEVESRDRLIDAQRERLESVRSHVDALADLLDTPLSAGAPQR